MNNELFHHGVIGQKWGVRRYQNPDGTRTQAGLAREGYVRNPNNRSVFVSGSSKTQTKDSPYYRKELNKDIKNHLNELMKQNVKFIVGDAPGIDRQVQDYLKKNKYELVEVYGPGDNVRYLANKNWKSNPIAAPEFEEYSPEWLRKKDIAMTNASTEGLAIILDEGAVATRNNIARLAEQNKDVKVYELSKDKNDKWIN